MLTHEKFQFMYEIKIRRALKNEGEMTFEETYLIFEAYTYY